MGAFPRVLVAATSTAVIPGRSGGAAEGKGIQGSAREPFFGSRRPTYRAGVPNQRSRVFPWIPFPALRAAGDDGGV
ncbi:hypothetical protein SLNSH_11005 [Alsobacter soli]|uniref:Uncharacterized protein n=1 Tax=Alsobacter soli TaxID=2109933 RepID=A0A2T1HTJ3_9HYPH|nr:hypothetical protein SLNSH_11005 [Alsobacter soli]